MKASFAAMCDETLNTTTATKLTRRAFAGLGAASAIIASNLATHGSMIDQAIAAGPQLTEGMVTITTPDSAPGHHADAFFVHPAQGRHPGIILWPDIAGLRDAYKAMGRRLAASGYAVLVINPFYRTAPAPLLSGIAEYFTPEGAAKIKPAVGALSPAGTVRDAEAFVHFLDAQPAVATNRGIGSSGYCLGGPGTVRTAFAAPGRVRAAASFHGASLVTDAPDSPHRLLAKTEAAYLFAIARNDDARAPGDKTALREAATAAHRPAEIAVYAGDHGWCTLDSPAYNHAEAERAWERMLSLFAQL